MLFLATFLAISKANEVFPGNQDRDRGSRDRHRLRGLCGSVHSFRTPDVRPVFFLYACFAHCLEGRVDERIFAFASNGYHCFSDLFRRIAELS